MQHRLFVGIDPPEAVKAQLLGLMGGVAGARWQTDEQLHLTLRFIGEVDSRQANDIADVLADLRHAAFDLALDGVGMFDRRGIPHALWVGVRPHDAVTALHHKVNQTLARAGVEPERRAYLPHITIARFSRSTGPVDAFIATNGGVTSAPFRVDSLCLYESQLTAEGSVYTIVERVRLG